MTKQILCGLPLDGLFGAFYVLNNYLDMSKTALYFRQSPNYLSIAGSGRFNLTITWGLWKIVSVKIWKIGMFKIVCLKNIYIYF